MPKHTPSARLMAAILASGALAGGAASAAQATSASSPAGRSAPASATRSAVAQFTQPTRITNPWLPLSVHRQVVLTGSDEGHELRSVRARLKHTEPFWLHGRAIRAAVIESHDYRDGVLHRVVLSYYAQADDGTVYRLGEDVDSYDASGRTVIDRTRASTYARHMTVAMAAEPRDGQRFPAAPPAVVDVVDTNVRLTVAKGTFNRVLVVRSAPGADEPSEVRYYARGVGMIKQQDASGALELASVR